MGWATLRYATLRYATLAEEKCRRRRRRTKKEINTVSKKINSNAED
jgi:hypothetical protein